MARMQTFIPVLIALMSTLVTTEFHNETEREYEIFFNRGFKQSRVKSPPGDKSKVDVLGSVLKRHVASLRKTTNKQVELVFLVDSSASVGAENFFNELKFVKKLLADFTVAYNQTRVAVITFSSRNRVVKHLDHLTQPSINNHKCVLLEKQLPKISYSGGGTYTLGAMLQAQEVLEHARKTATKAVFLITDGYSNGGDPRPAAKTLRDEGVRIFTFGIQNGNVRELYDMASDPPEEHSYILDSFEEFEALARRALHEDLHIGNYLPQDSSACSRLCPEGGDCCDKDAQCTCGTHTGYYACLCRKGYFGNGLNGDCHPCPPATYWNNSGPGDLSSCLPCPDVNHYSEPGSTSPIDCKCKSGYQEVNKQCVVLKCPHLKPPKHGFFVNDYCNNVFNAACGIRCEPGYKLVGSSIRLCAENGSWTGEDATCEMKACPPLNKPRHGSISCTTENFVFETECHFSCDPGYTLVGSKERTCLAIALWDGLPALCRSINCPSLSPLANGIITPSKCTQGKNKFGEICQFDCKEGFVLNGPSSKQCIDPGIWSSENIQSTCVDVQPPVIKCPENIVVDAEENEASALVKWEIPMAVDNSRDIPTISVIPAIIPPRRFHIGVSTITYIAEDKNKNKKACNFTVTVRDTQPPVVDKCVSPPTFLSREIPVDVSWEEPMFSDNSGGKVTIWRSHEPGYFSLGETSVIYEAHDEAGNNNTCIINIVVQEHACNFPSNPINGHTNCTETEKAVYCSLSCKEGYAFAIHPPESYFCEYNGVWKPEEDIPIPDCSVVELSNSLYQTGVVSVIADGFDCKNSFFVSQVKSHLQHQISNKISKVCNEPIQCSVDQLSIDCDQNKEETEEENNIISQKKRRSIDLKTIADHSKVGIESYLLESVNTSKNVAEFKSYSSHHAVLDLKQKFNGSSQRYLQNEDNVIEVEFELAGNRNSLDEQLETNLQQELLDRMETAMNILKTAAQKGELDLSLGSRRVKIEHLRFKRSNPKFVCEPGSVIEGNQCIKCPVGTFFNVLFEYCEGCSLGTYQFQEGQLSCLVCPERTSTTTGQSKSVGECKAQCLPGSFSSTGLEVCETCPRGYYQPHYAQTSCLSCPGLTTTWRRGARRQDECQETCPPGYVSTTGLFPCFACPIGYFQPAAGEKACYRCPNGATTNSQGSTSVNDCAGMNKILKDDKLTIPLSDLLLVNDCFSVPCLNGATCEALDFGFLCHCVPGYTGIYCENEINECESTPCKNNATCRDLLNDYVCVCLPGFTGNLCQKNIDECAYEPCLNGGICTDHINKFSCKCPEGYVGPVCQYNIDDCLSNPCQNGATCQDLIANYTCHCIRGFTGRNCETNIDDCADDFCQNNATCIDGIEEFICQCLPGFRGRLCEDDVNECQSEPCMNGATCFDQIAHFTCLCAPSFTGDLCETELSQDFFLVFPSSGTLDFLQLEGFQHPLDHVTVCLWMTTVDKHNYGTPLSYANETVDNLFTLTDYNGFVFYINMQEVVTDVTANDGKWHHICVTWSSPTGAWSIYKDGEQADKGIGLAVGTFIPTDGILVVGQEQDGKGSGFSSPESFIGSMSLLQIWDYVLTPEEISTFTTRCDNYKGNVRAWSDFLGGIFGRVEKKSSDFCRGCNIPAVLIHGDVTVSGVKTNALATYLCHPGYKITGSVSRKCMVYGDWSGESPSCTRISCGFPGYLNNGFISGRSYLYQDTIQYFCNSGYHLKGGSIRTCQADGYWKGEPPYCEEILCSPPLPLENGKVITSLRKYKPSHKVQFKCDDGYKLDGASYLICGNDGQWNQSQPVCQPKSCESPPRVLHGQVVGQQQKFEVGSVVYYKCNNGYMISNSNAVKCAIKSRWEGDIPRCERVNCGLPPVIPNANYEGRDHKFGGVITYRCELGYELVSNGEISCLENGVWSKPIPHCKPVSCGKLVTPENGYIQVNNYTFSNVAKYFCNTGYELQGIRSRKCRATRDWSGESPVCVPVSCSQPESIPNGKFVGNDWTVGNIVTYSCHPGYMLKGEMERVCLESGQWLHETPMCDPIECSPPDHVQHARIHGKDYHFGHRVEYQCEIGYELIGQAIRVCLEDQHWGPEPPICRPVSCGRPIQIENGEVITTNNTFTGEANYRCQVGFRLEGNQRRRCLADGKWDGLDPSCEIIKCAEPMQVQHAYLLYSDVRYGSVVEYYCDEGYKLKGLSQRICREDGFWEGEEPYCETIRCQSPSVIENGDIMVPDTKFGTHISYSCHRGYELEGPSSRVCQQDEQWSGKEPKCLPIYCPDDELKLPNGHIKLESNLMGSVILYSCDVGFELIGLISRTCQENKEWEGMPPICAKVTCPPPIPPLNGEVVWFNHSFGDSITYSCHKGYTLQGDLHRICLPDGTWSNQEPFCEPIKCSLPSNIEYGYVRYDNLNYRSKVKYSCHNGYKLIGSKYIECRADHSWDGAVPHCEQILCPEPPPIKYGHHMTENFTIGSRAIYACDKGFIMDSSKLECNANGKWIGKIPSCNIVSCSAPSKFKFGKIIGKNFTYGNTIHFKCNSGWELIGNSVLFCEETGNWNSSYPSCIGTFCPSPEVIHHGQIIATDLKYGTSITYHCNPGYQLIGDSYRKCEIDNTWSGKPPKCLPVLCPEPPDIAQGTKIGNLFEFGSNVTFECNHGYLLHGLSTLHCLENGTWSASIPVCVEVSCSIPERVKNGEVVVPIRKRQYQKDDSMQADEGFLLGHRGDITVDSDMIIEASQSDIFRLGARVIYKCAKGFHLEGERMRTCQKDGHWSGETPYCKAVSCNNVSSIENGNVSVSTITFLSEINYTCNSGYKLIGSNKRICLSNGSWSGNSPHCVLIKCSQPSSIPHGNVKWDNLNYGGIAMYECNTGYRLIGNVSRICQNNEHWSGLEPNCQPLECTKLTNPNNGWVQTNSLMVGTLAKYGCKEGYELTGPAIRTCLMNETWSSTIPSCHITSCFPLPAVKYGYIIGLKFTFGSVVKYKCYTGYTLIGPAERSCLANKSWSGESPQCNPLNCPRPHAPHHGSVYVPKLAVGSYANYSCYEGYELRGNSSRMCMPELMWSGDVPNCVIINCSSVTTIPYGSVMYTNFTFGSAVKFSCLPKYQLLGSEEIWCLPNKEWSSDIPTCNRYICDNLNNDKHTLISPLGPHQVGQTVKFNCIMGYQLQGKNMLKCDANGHWEQSIPRCIPVECGPPPEIMNGRISFLSNNKSNSIQYMYKSKIAYVCNDGYELNGSRVLECERDGYWVGEKPQCIEVNCGHPPIVHHSTVQVEHKPGLSTAIYLCNYGYKLIGSEKHFCKDGKEWNINNTHCEKIFCGPPPYFQYSKSINLLSNNYEVGSYVTYTCLPGYENIGGESLSCSEENKWIGRIPNCLPISCSKPPAPKHGIVKGEEYTFQSIVLYSCDKGYKLIGKDTRECQSDGKWGGDIPECKIIHCNELNEPRNGYLWKEVEIRQPIVGDRIWFSCENGYNLVGSESIQCQENGLWKPEIPHCAAITCPPPTDYPPKTVIIKHEEMFSFGDQLAHVCEAGYRPDGDLTIKCLENGTWSQPNGICSKVSCGRPQINNGGIVLGMSYMYHDKVVIKCPPGSKSSGKVVLTCKGNGKWNDEPYCQALCPHPCLNGGHCIPPGICACPPGFAGELCQQAICILPCLNGGTCIEPYKCSCEEGFTGSRCETAICQPHCQNSGLCIAPNLCRCRINFRGPQCQYENFRNHRPLTRYKY